MTLFFEGTKIFSTNYLHSMKNSDKCGQKRTLTSQIIICFGNDLVTISCPNLPFLSYICLYLAESLYTVEPKIH